MQMGDACSSNVNVELSTSYCDDNYMDDDYFIVMVYVNQNLLGYLCMLRLRCKHSHINQLKMANNLLNST
jgi:hypothetical protein